MTTPAEVFATLDGLRRQASIAQIGGFRPSDDPFTSWFGGYAVADSSEGIPRFGKRPMFPLLQVNCAELPYVPGELEGVALFVVWLNQDEIPFGQPHGQGWLIREYWTLAGLQPLQNVSRPEFLKTFPIRWLLSETEGPGWETAWELVDMGPVNASEAASRAFFERYANHRGTKLGGYPTEIQGGLTGDSSFVLQIGSEEKANWMWADNGIGYLLKSRSGEWAFQCQSY